MRVNGTRFGLVCLLLAVLTATGFAAPVPAERAKAERELAALGTKLHGRWHGEGGCVGNLTFRADGTYEWTHRGPGGHTDTGAWAVRGEPMAPVLKKLVDGVGWATL